MSGNCNAQCPAHQGATAPNTSARPVMHGSTLYLSWPAPSPVPPENDAHE